MGPPRRTPLSKQRVAIRELDPEGPTGPGGSAVTVGVFPNSVGRRLVSRGVAAQTMGIRSLRILVSDSCFGFSVRTVVSEFLFRFLFRIMLPRYLFRCSIRILAIAVWGRLPQGCHRSH